jgi:hypothetical protein
MKPIARFHDISFAEPDQLVRFARSCGLLRGFTQALNDLPVFFRQQDLLEKYFLFEAISCAFQYQLGTEPRRRYRRINVLFAIGMGPSNRKTPQLVAD